MPFDGFGFDPRPEPPKRATLQERVLLKLCLSLGLLLLLLPVSADSVADLLRYLAAM